MEDLTTQGTRLQLDHEERREPQWLDHEDPLALQLAPLCQSF